VTDWEQRYLDLAKHISTWSKDPSRQIGAVAVGDSGQILSIGYNGFPRGINDDERLHDRETKYSLVVHAEMNAIYNATLNGISLRNSTLYVWGLPVCSDCARGVIQVGITRVVMNSLDDTIGHWKDHWQKTRTMFDEANVQYRFV
jgi:dCMP deaminase